MPKIGSIMFEKAKFFFSYRTNKLTVNSRRLTSLFDIVLNAKNDSIAIITRESRRLNNRKAVKLT